MMLCSTQTMEKPLHRMSFLPIVESYWQIFDRANTVSLIGLLLGLLAVALTQFSIAGSMISLMAAGIADGLDGWCARRDSRTPWQSAIGKQLDSLVDLCCFGWVPMLILGLLGYQQLTDYLIMAFYLTCAVLRLAVFNCIGLQRVNDRSYFVGLPITSMALILPIGLLVGRLIPAVQELWLIGLVLLTAIGMIAPLPVPKLAGRGLVGAIGGLIVVALIYLFT
jgi:CDP-diacylglycerol---serine O-phosphatidyltransferase